MGLSTAERNRNKRERKKLLREEQRKLETTRASDAAVADNEKEAPNEPQVEIEYVAEPVMQMAAGDSGSGGADGNGGSSDVFEALRRFQERADAIVVSDDERGNHAAATSTLSTDDGVNEDGGDDEYNSESISKRRIRDMIRPSVAELKRRVERPDLVEAHDVTASDPEFLIQLKAVPGTVPVPRHWGRKRKYLQGKVRLCYVMQCYVIWVPSPTYSFILLYVCTCMGPATTILTYSFWIPITERI
jgi:splicing factor 3B subunit 2